MKYMRCVIIVLFTAVGKLMAGEAPWIDVPNAQWKGVTAAEVPSLKCNSAAAVALPAKEAQPLTASTATAQPPGLYEVRLTLRPSHVADAVAFQAGLRVKLGEVLAAEFPGKFFARVHQPEIRTLQVVQSNAGPLTLALEAFANGKAADSKKAPDAEQAVSLTPEQAVYYLVDKIEFRPLSCSGRVTKVETDKIRYKAGETLKGSAVVADVGGKGGTGTLNLYLEHGLKDRTKAKSLPVTLTPESQTLTFELPLPKEELGYALVAEFVSADGADRSEAAEYFGIADNFARVSIWGGGLETRDAILSAEDEPRIRKKLAQSRADYFNAVEYPFWAPDDMLAMSPDAVSWTSGQANYRMNKETMQRQIRLAHEQGISVATYGKWGPCGRPGWDIFYDRPNDFSGSSRYHVGMWHNVNVNLFDRTRGGDFRVYSKRPKLNDSNMFQTWWSMWMPLPCDSTPNVIRLAAEECVRSIDMFGWDMIRWDDHPRAAGWAQCGQKGNFQHWAARNTQALVRYFKDIVGEKHPDFRHGYNYMMIELDKGYDWAVEDFELDELCRGGGMVMNESMGNHSGGWAYSQIARNLQVESDLCRERGGYYQAFSTAATPRDTLIDSALWAASGCRVANGKLSREARRYCTRYSQYSFDENLRRLATPEKVLEPQGATKLWWQPFVYETPLADGKRQLIVNLLNLPLEAKHGTQDWNMQPGTDPVTFALTLPAGLSATGVSLIDPQTLAVTPLPLKDGRFEVPAVASWQVAVIDLAAAADAPALASLYGTQKTLGAERAELKEERKPEVILDLKAGTAALNKQMEALWPEWVIKDNKAKAAFDALSGEAREQALLDRRRSPEDLAKEWWKGAAIPADLALKDKRPVFGDLAPRRNGSFDIFYGRGAMDYRLNMPLAFAHLDRFRFLDAKLSGTVHSGPGGIWLDGAVPGNRYADFDLFVLTSIPHAAIGVENSYALADYVKAGGAVFFTGGEYAFGKGGYMHTVLERELLPFQCAGMNDTVYSEPQTFTPGPDFGELKTQLDFVAKPSFWVRNEVVLKPGAKVFLKYGDLPILVGWQVGKGRVACLLLDHRGKSEKGDTAFFDWADWPKLAAAVMTWLAPEAGHEAVDTAATSEIEAKPVMARLRAAVASPEFAKQVEEQLKPEEEDFAKLGNARDLAMAMALYAKTDLAETGRRLVEGWDKRETDVRAEFAKVCGPDTEMLDTSPTLEAESIFARFAWLAYLSRLDPKAYGEPFLREWLRVQLYADYCGRTRDYLIHDRKMNGAQAKTRWNDLAERFVDLQELTRSDAEAVLAKSPESAATALANAHFMPEAHTAINLIGSLDRAAVTSVFTAVKSYRNADLAAFAAERQREKK